MARPETLGGLPVRVVLFGAGASFGSDVSGTPPLGPDLFLALTQSSPEWASLPAPWPARFKSDFEGAMAALIQAGIFAALQWSMAAYFFKQFRVSDASVYLRLLRELVGTDQNIAFVTLNYETLLFQAAPKVGMTLSIGAEQRVGTTFPLVLPHGSSILKCIGVSGTRGVSFTGVSTSGSVSIMQGSHEFDQERAKNVFRLSCPTSNRISSPSAVQILSTNIASCLAA
jgi:hypothetical protein